MSDRCTVKIHLLAFTLDGILVVFTSGDCWQFRVLTHDGDLFGLKKIYHTAEAAEKAGREWVGVGW